ncbi:hypothetical protein KJ359_001503 [Pestalotiopsis sp. 9143b]|nr:hypothetical protein KJ359_001503 [Pestalotiopsis sp. 9143b]
MADEYREEPTESQEPTAGGAPSHADVEMGEDGEGAAENADASELPFAEGGEDQPEVEKRIEFIDYLKSPMVTLLVGDGDKSAILTAHQALLQQSPSARSRKDGKTEQLTCAQQPRQIELSAEDVDSVGCFLEFLYTGDYYPKKIAGTRELEHEPNTPAVDESGDQLLKHARVYTLAEKFGVEKLRSLATSKIHCVNSTAKGEIAYARYVYAYTDKDDTSIRAPVANFWATRSHTLRAEAEEEFRSICLEFPQFGYDVLTRVLDEKLKRQGQGKMFPAASSGGGGGRKRARHSNV